ncbi:MAG: Flp pilus assembly protein CpaB [Candidatus Aenigmatarchaeota archaeon]
MDRRVINIAIGVGLAIIAIMLIERHLSYQNRRIEELLKKGELVKVVVATRDIPKETTITSDMVKIEMINAKAFQPGDFDSLDSVVGKFAEVDILKGQHINSSMLRAAGLLKYLSQGVPMGLRAITIPVDKISSLEGLIKPEDRVDIIGMFNIPTGKNEFVTTVVTLFQGVKVLAIGRNISKYKTGDKEPDTVTIALSPEDIKIITYALEIGKIKLVLRSDLDTSKDESYSAINMEALLKRLGLWQEKVPMTRPDTVKVYKGAVSEDKPVSR